jgi:hypothetical protein
MPAFDEARRGGIYTQVRDGKRQVLQARWWVREGEVKDELGNGTASDRPTWHRRQGAAVSEMQESLLNIVRGATSNVQRTRVRNGVAMLDGNWLRWNRKVWNGEKMSKAKGDRETYKSNWDEPMSIQQK